jgi:hypothetical protein
MCRNALMLALAGLFTLATFAHMANAYSDFVGIYARVDKVVFEPDNKAPERIQVWGAFALAKDGGSTYEPARRGYLYFTLQKGKESICRKEWADLKLLEGTDEIAGFGMRYSPQPRIRKDDEKPASPDVYPISNGIVKMKNSEYAPIRDINSLPKGAK